MLPDGLILHFNRSIERTYGFIRDHMNSQFTTDYAFSRLRSPVMNGLPVPSRGSRVFDPPLMHTEFGVIQDLQNSVKTLQVTRALMPPPYLATLWASQYLHPILSD